MGKGLLRWEIHQRQMSHFRAPPLPREEKARRRQAFRDLFEPELKARGFLQAGKGFWRVREEGFVQYVLFTHFRSTPTWQFIGCGSEWSLMHHAREVLLGKPYIRWYGFAEPTGLQRFTGLEDPVLKTETLFDMTDDFDKGLRLEYDRFLTHALPLLEAPCSCEAYAQKPPTLIPRALAWMYLRRWEEAQEALESRIAFEEAQAREHGGSCFTEAIQAYSSLLEQLRRGEYAQADALVRQAEEYVYKDLTSVSKRLAKQFRFRDGHVPE